MLKVKQVEIDNEHNLVKTKAGYIFDSSTNNWAITEGVNRKIFNFSSVNASENFINEFKKVTAFYLENKSLSHANNIFSKTKMLINYSGENVGELNIQHFLNYKASLKIQSQGVLSTIAGALKRWVELGYAGISNELYVLLNEIKLTGNPKGEAVATMDPINGPLSEIEYQALHDALELAYEKEEISVREYLLVRLFVSIGMRPIQYAGMKLSDLHISKGEEGNDIYLLRIPRAKKRSVSRTHFLERKISEKIALRFEKQKKEVESQYAGFERLEDLPLFPSKREDGWAEELQKFKEHSTSFEISRELTNIVDRLRVMSERTNDILRVTSRRLRRTVGTRTAQEGHGALIIAEVLDHTDIQNVGVYVQVSEEIMARIDKAIALKMAPMAQAFKGILINDESNAVRGNDPASRIFAPKETGGFKPAGNCGSLNMCNFLAPLACYTCISFQPWLDGPHEQVLESLIANRERLNNISGQRIAAIEDKTILAVAHVVSLCQKKLGGEK